MENHGLGEYKVEHYAFCASAKPKRKTDGEENRGSQKLPRLAAAKIGHYTIRPKLDLLSVGNEKGRIFHRLSRPGDIFRP